MYSNSVSDLNALKQEISATKATWKEWLTASDRCRPVIPGKSHAFEVLKTDIYSKCMENISKNKVATQQVRLEASILGGVTLHPHKVKGSVLITQLVKISLENILGSNSCQ